jgi:adenine-specific DNA methylase
MDSEGLWRSVTEDELKSPWNLYLEDVNLGDKIVLDPMMGGGTTIIDSLKLGCKVIGQDLNPVSWFLVKMMVEPVERQSLENAFEELELRVSSDVMKYYKTICPDCELPADTIYHFWVKELPCLECTTNIPLFRGYVLTRRRNKDLQCVICPSCGNLFDSSKNVVQVECSICKTKFDPIKSKNVEGKHYKCTNPDCGCKNRIVDAVQELGKPKERLYAIEYYCPKCKNKGYKKAESFDFDLYEQAKKEYTANSETWRGQLVPDTTIPIGKETYPRLIKNHGYRYWSDMFNERQLLSLGKILAGITELGVSDQIRNLLLITFSKSLEYNNMLCEYDRSNRKLSKLFSKHAFHPPLNPVENNVWGSGYGLGTFLSMIRNTLLAKDYNSQPFEKYIEKGKTLQRNLRCSIDGRVGNLFEDRDSNVMLMCDDSTTLRIPDGSVDAIITDPPYFGNVMYSELSEFYYAWLRLILKHEFENFRDEHVPSAAEVVVNSTHQKDGAVFVEGLTAIFNEAGRKLKEDGLLVFTFHHREEEAWDALQRSISDSGFYISTVYPIHSEKRTSRHIFEKNNILYDMIIICRRNGLASIPISLEDFVSEIQSLTENEVKRLERENMPVTKEDSLVISTGFALALFSQHYPEVYKEQNQISFHDALMQVRSSIAFGTQVTQN